MLRQCDGRGADGTPTLPCGECLDRPAREFCGLLADCRSAQVADADPAGGKKSPIPPFSAAEAALKVRLAEDAWNRQDPAAISQAYSEDSVWRNRTEFITGRAAIRKFLSDKWTMELEYRLAKELWCVGTAGSGAEEASQSTHPPAVDKKGLEAVHSGMMHQPAESHPAPDLGYRIGVRFAYEYVTPSGEYMRAYGNENWEFNEHGLMTRRIASINDMQIKAEDRKLTWPSGQPRPASFPGLSALGL